MSQMPDLYSIDAVALSQVYQAGDITPSDMAEAMFARIDAVNPRINAVITQGRQAARAAAATSTERWRIGRPLSPLDGTPVTIKDNLLAAGLPASWGSTLYRDFRPAADELPVARLRRAGVVILGKTNVPEFTLQGYTDNALFGPTRNPFALELTPGGSTGGGAAALAAGIGTLALGTDGGGSLRRPAAHCGLFAFKPSIGQIARSGGFPQVLADFEVVGPLARTARDLSAAFDVLSGSDAMDPKSIAALTPERLPNRPRIGFFSEVEGAPVDPAIVDATERFAAILKHEGCAVERVPAPFRPDLVNSAWGQIAATGMARLLAAHPGAENLVGENALNLSAAGRTITAVDLLAAEENCAAIRSNALQVFRQYDLLLCPATAALAWPAREAFPPMIAGRPVGPRGHAVFTAWMNVASLCAATIPVAMTADGGGIGLQLIAAPRCDRALLDFMMRIPAIAELHAGSTEGLN